MARLLAGGVPVVELVGSEEVAGVEGVRTGEGFWPWTNLAAAGEEMCVEQRNENLSGCSPLSKTHPQPLSLKPGPCSLSFPSGAGVGGRTSPSCDLHTKLSSSPSGQPSWSQPGLSHCLPLSVLSLCPAACQAPGSVLDFLLREGDRR